MKLRGIYRIALFIPPDSVPQLESALRATGVLTYGEYSDVYWASSVGTETFTPLPGSSPTSGAHGEITRSPSVEVVFSIERDKDRLQTVIDAIRSAHPWEEPVVYIDETFALSSEV